MGSVTFPAQPGETLVCTNATTASATGTGEWPQNKSVFHMIIEIILLIFNNDILSVNPEHYINNTNTNTNTTINNSTNGNATTPHTNGTVPGQNGTAQQELDLVTFFAALETVFPNAQKHFAYRAFKACALGLRWFTTLQIPAPVVLLVFVGIVAFMNPRATRRWALFARNLVTFAVRVVRSVPEIIGDIFFSNRLVQDPVPLWIARFFGGFALGLLGSLFGEAPAREPVPPLSPPPVPPRPLSPPRRRARNTFTPDIDSDDEDDEDEGVSLFGREWGRRVDRAVDRAREYQQARRDHEARAAARERQRAWEETPDRTGREPRTLRAETDYWWPWVRIALAGLSVVGVVFGVVYYCQMIENGEECGWLTQTICGESVGVFEPLGYNDEAIREASMTASGPVRYRFLANGSKARISSP
ncbi:hypothetical protein F4859DRAFT_285292 [Xylaria cf. heliscus]|nr:hypothetical protein F4859DRAFT_285292 [Xylaria cf. heliscus]